MNVKLPGSTPLPVPAAGHLQSSARSAQAFGSRRDAAQSLRFGDDLSRASDAQARSRSKIETLAENAPLETVRPTAKRRADGLADDGADEDQVPASADGGITPRQKSNDHEVVPEEARLIEAGLEAVDSATESAPVIATELPTVVAGEVTTTAEIASPEVDAASAPLSAEANIELEIKLAAMADSAPAANQVNAQEIAPPLSAHASTEAISQTGQVSAALPPRSVAASRISSTEQRNSEDESNGSIVGDPVDGIEVQTGKSAGASIGADVAISVAPGDATEANGEGEPRLPATSSTTAHPSNLPTPTGGDSSAAFAAPASQGGPEGKANAAGFAQFLPQPGASLRDDENAGRIARGLQSAVNHRGGAVTLRLSPPELGALRIDMVVRDGVVTAQFTAEHESVRNLLRDQMSHLRQGLDRQGLVVDRLEVKSPDSSAAWMQQRGGGSGDDASHDGRSAGYEDASQRQQTRRRRDGSDHSFADAVSLGEALASLRR